MEREENRRVDLDVVRAAQRELEGRDPNAEPPSIKFKGETFYLDEDLPLDAIEVMGELGEVLDAIDAIEIAEGAEAAQRAAVKLGPVYVKLAAAMLGDEWERFRKLRPGLEILVELCSPASLDELYPTLAAARSSGEGGSSGDSSERGSGRSRRSSPKRTRR